MDLINSLGAALQFATNPDNSFITRLFTHLELSGIALLVALAGVPLGIVISRYGPLSRIVVNITGILRVVPSLAVLFLLIPWLHTGFRPAAVALALLAIPPVLINTDTGMKGVDPAIVEAGRGMGMSRMRLLTLVQLPLAIPVIIAGIRAATVEVIASASLASLIGAGGLGDFIAIGLSRSRPEILLVGAIPIALLAFIAEASLARLQRRLSAHITDTSEAQGRQQ